MAHGFIALASMCLNLASGLLLVQAYPFIGMVLLACIFAFADACTWFAWFFLLFHAHLRFRYSGSQDLFLSHSMLGQSLQPMEPLGPFGLQLFPTKRRSLGACYNEVIDIADSDSMLVFLHDDLSIDDLHVGQRLEAALDVYDLVCVAGNRRCQAH